MRVRACFGPLSSVSTGVVAEKDGGFLHHHRVGKAEQGPSTGGNTEGVMEFRPDSVSFSLSSIVQLSEDF